jgi:LCP family protein required for cell wall assembly
MSGFREDRDDPGTRPPRSGSRAQGPGGRAQRASGAGQSASGGGQSASGGAQRASGSGQRTSGGGATYAGGGRSAGGRQSGLERPYTLYRSTPRSLGARLRGETDAELEARADQLSRQQPPRPPRGGGPTGPPPRRGWRRIPGFGPSLRPLWHPLRLLKYAVMFCVFWVVLSVVLFFISASGDAGNLPGGNATKAALASGGPMLFTANNILVVGLDTRPTSGYSSHEGGLSAADHNELTSRTDTLMIWHVGGGSSSKLSIPRDTLVNIPSCGHKAKINAAWVCGGPKATIQAVETLTGLKINHMIVVDLGNFVKFIDDIGGVTVNTPKICSNISGGAKNGGYTLDLARGSHHLTGIEAVTLARTRDNSCNPAYTDINREKMQQGIMNGIKNQLLSAHAFFNLPWASWDAPKAVQTDMGPLTLMQLFAAAEIGGSSPARTLKESGGFYGSQDVLIPNSSDVQRKVQQLLNG